MPTVLLSWELGRGAGHLRNLRRIARRLKPHGLRLVAVVPDPAGASLLRDVCDEVIAAPAWPSHTSEIFGTLGDILASRGLGDRNTLTSLLTAWRTIFDRIKPDLVIGDLAPAAALAARGRIPIVLTGNGYTLPPDTMHNFPLLDGLGARQWEESKILASVNAVLQSTQQETLGALPQIFSADARLVQTFALLDPYYLERTESIDGPLFEQAPVPRAADGSNIFVYLSGSYDVPPELVSALIAFGDRVHIHAPRLNEGQRCALRGCGAIVHNAPLSAADMLGTTQLAVHTGGSGIAAEALAAGVPQLVLSSHVEQELNGAALQRAGAGRWIKADDSSEAISSDAIAAMLEDQVLSERAEELGHLHRDIVNAGDPAGRLEKSCLALLRG